MKPKAMAIFRDIFFKITTYSIVVSLAFSQYACVAGMPRPLPHPTIERKPQTLKVVGSAERGQYKTKQMISFQKADGSFELRGVELPVKDAKLIDALNENGAASFFISEGTPNYQVLLEKGEYKSDIVVAPLLAFGFIAVVIFFPVVVFAIFPWPDRASSEIHLKVYDSEGALLSSIEEKAGVTYCNWGPFLLTSYGRKKAQRLYDSLNERAAIKAVEAIQAKQNSTTTRSSQIENQKPLNP